MTTHEQVMAFGHGDETLFGVTSMPAHHAGDLGLVIVVGGPQYRAGSHRQFVLLARHLASHGIPALRFDVRGMGDSTGEMRTFESLDDDVSAAINAWIANEPNIRRVVLWGLCDGASAALLYLLGRRDARVVGICLVNPWVRSEQSLARAEMRHYYVQRIVQGAFWRKLLSGGIGAQAIQQWLSQVLRILAGASRPRSQHSALGFQDRMLRAVATFPGHVFVALSGRDLTAQEFAGLVQSHPGWSQAMARPNVDRRDFPQADHTFSDNAEARSLNAATLEWLRSLPAIA